MQSWLCVCLVMLLIIQVAPSEIRVLTKVAQEAFLKQLLEVGFFHGGKCIHAHTYCALRVMHVVRLTIVKKYCICRVLYCCASTATA
jgi:hypothetical protein